MGLQPHAERRVFEEIHKLFTAFRWGWIKGGNSRILKFDDFAWFIQEFHRPLFEYLTLEMFLSMMEAAD